MSPSLYVMIVAACIGLIGCAAQAPARDGMGRRGETPEGGTRMSSPRHRISPRHRTFYVGYSHGSESNSGLSEFEPWRRAPGMQGFTASYAHEAGDHFVFEGGVTWPNSVLPLAPPEGRDGSGEAGNPDVYGVSESWYAGASYTPPVFDAENKEVTAGCARQDCGEYNTFVNLSRDDYITVENIHFVGWANTKHGPYGTCGVIFFENAQNEHAYETDEHITINKVTINDFTVGDKIEDPQLVADEPSQESEGRRCAAIVGRSGTTTAPEGESVVENSTIEGAAPSAKSPSGGSFVEGIRNVPNAIDDRFWGMNNMYFPGGGGGVIAGNRFEDCGYPEFPEGYTGEDHANVMEFIDTETERIAGKPFYIYDNVINGTGYNGGLGACEPSFLGRGTVYVWNNVYLHIQGNTPEVEAQNNTVGKDYFYNNSVESSGGYGHCFDAGHGGEINEIVLKNNLCVGKELGPSGTHELHAKTLTETHNLIATPTTLAKDGYNSNEETYPFAPTSSSATGVGQGTNLHSLCTGPLEQLCHDTNYAGTRTPITRPNSGNWDIGAYQWCPAPDTKARASAGSRCRGRGRGCRRCARPAAGGPPARGTSLASVELESSSTSRA